MSDRDEFYDTQVFRVLSKFQGSRIYPLSRDTAVPLMARNFIKYEYTLSGGSPQFTITEEGSQHREYLGREVVDPVNVEFLEAIESRIDPDPNKVIRVRFD